MSMPAPPNRVNEGVTACRYTGSECPPPSGTAEARRPALGRRR
jgi:hypothetical protein